MSEPRIRRFAVFQIIFHWMIAIPYMALLASGALLILHRLRLLDVVPGPLLSRIHRWVGIALVVVLAQLFLAAASGGHLRAILRDLADWICFRRRDLLWLLVIPLNAILPGRFPAPPAGRFNAGQKLHGAFIILAIGTFAATGILMMLRPADVRPWVIHSWLFFGAVGFLLLHLFLGLVNPPTRRALSGMFTGVVPQQYVQDHHSLSIAGSAGHAHPHAVVSLKAIAITSLLASGAAAGLLWHYGAGRASHRLTELVRLDHPMISPGPLAAAHASDPRAASCAACHVALKPPSDAACLACHPAIRTVMRDRIGFHGQLTGKCRDCHADHRGKEADLRGLDARTFNHRLARFDLQGQHRTLQCDQCHLQHSGVPGKRKFIGLSFAACTDCHANPHDDPKTVGCTRCHTQRGWGGQNLVFDHQHDADFPLDGKHASVACAKCHSLVRATLVAQGSPPPKPLHTILAFAAAPGANHSSSGTFQMLHIGRTCADCHADPHSATLGADCQRCHTTAGWTGRDLRFDHNRDTHFPLESSHAKLSCERCHKLPAALAPLALASLAHTPSSCATCHTDPHDGKLGSSCTRCHTQTQWTGRQLLFSHKRDSQFILKGRHSQLACTECHKPPPGSTKLARATFAGLPGDCMRCHQDPHAGQFKQSCANCHGERGWKGNNLLFSHNRDSKFKIDALHGRVACAACHKPEKRSLQFRPTPASCETCHATIADAMAGTIAGASFAPDPHGGRVRCTDCHQPAAPKPTAATFAQACAACHNPRYRDLYFDWQKSLDARTAAAEALIEAARATNPGRAAIQSKRLSAARQAGFHNTSASVKLLDQLCRDAAAGRESELPGIKRPLR